MEKTFFIGIIALFIVAVGVASAGTSYTLTNCNVQNDPASNLAGLEIVTVRVNPSGSGGTMVFQVTPNPNNTPPATDGWISKVGFPTGLTGVTVTDNVPQGTWRDKGVVDEMGGFTVVPIV